MTTQENSLSNSSIAAIGVGSVLALGLLAWALSPKQEEAMASDEDECVVYEKIPLSDVWKPVTHSCTRKDAEGYCRFVKRVRPDAELYVHQQGSSAMATSPHEIQHLRLGPDGRTYFLWGQKWVPMLDKERLAHPAMASRPRLGSGERFHQLESELAAKGAYDPAALSAWIGRKKYGAKKFAKLSHHKR